MSRQRVYCCAATALLFLLLSVGGSVLTARREQPKPIPEPPGAENQKKALPPFRQHAAVEAKRKEAEAALDKMFAEYDLKPHGLPAIPDDPPPHEGAMIVYPVVIEPPDLLLVELLEALPGRPISGERLVRQDGMVSLGFYGDVHVAGLTLKQAKVKIIQHLRRFLSDEVLGLYEMRFDEEDEKPGDAKPPKVHVPLPDLPKDGDLSKLDLDEKPKQEANKPHAVPSGYKVRSVRQGKEVHSYYGRSHPGASVRLLGRFQEPEEKKAEEPRKPVKIPLEAGGQVTITIEVQSGEKKEKEEVAAEADDWVPGPLIHPENSDRVFVDITAHNSNNYYVEGDLGQPGRLPFTVHETVMDALNYAGGLLPTAEPKDIRLVRPGRGGKPARVYKVDLEAIRERGDVTSNYQIFPGDRLIVGRNDVVKKTIQVDRLASGMQTVVNSILQESFMLRSLQTANPENHGAILKDLVDFWIQEMKRPDGVALDEQTLRDALIRRLQAKPEKPTERK
jgi:protein involved in polysaccharide export with SLBB domain